LQSLMHSLSLWYIRSLESERKIFRCEWRRMSVAFVGGWPRVDGPLGLRTSHVDGATTRYGLDGLVFASMRTRKADIEQVGIIVGILNSMSKRSARLSIALIALPALEAASTTGHPRAHWRVLAAAVGLPPPGLREREGFESLLVLLRSGSTILHRRHSLARLIDIAVLGVLSAHVGRGIAAPAGAGEGPFHLLADSHVEVVQKTAGRGMQ